MPTTNGNDCVLLLTEPPANKPDLIHFQYDFDATSNILGIRDQRSPNAVPAGDPRRNTQQFSYDSLYRLTRVEYSFGVPDSESENNGEIRYRYDRIGNMLVKESDLQHVEQGLSLTDLGNMVYGGEAGSWNRVGRDQGAPGPHALTGIAEPASLTLSRSYPYDGNGNMLSIDGLGCTWDFRDRIVAVEKGDMRAEYVYDYTNRRIGKRVVPKGENVERKTQTVTTVYINKYFEIRNHDQPVKYIWNGDTRIARSSRSLSSNERDSAATYVRRVESRIIGCQHEESTEEYW